MLSRFSHDRLCNPMDSSPPDSSAHRILQARIPEWAAISFSVITVYSLSFSASNNFPTLWMRKLRPTEVKKAPCTANLWVTYLTSMYLSAPCLAYFFLAGVWYPTPPHSHRFGSGEAEPLHETRRWSMMAEGHCGHLSIPSYAAM